MTSQRPASHNSPLAAPARDRVLAQARFETRTILRNGEQLLVTIVLPVLVLVGLTRAELVHLGAGSTPRVDLVTPGVLALAVMSTAFTSQAIATSFDRRNGVLRLLATTPLGPGGLLAGKVLAVLTVEAVQVAVLGTTALALGWRPDGAGILLAVLVLALGTTAFTSLALLVAGTLRFEAVLATANLLLVLLAIGGGLVLPATQLPGPLAAAARALPSGALGDALRSALVDGTLPLMPVLVLLGWVLALTWAARRHFHWQ